MRKIAEFLKCLLIATGLVLSFVVGLLLFCAIPVLFALWLGDWAVVLAFILETIVVVAVAMYIDYK